MRDVNSSILPLFAHGVLSTVEQLLQGEGVSVLEGGFRALGLAELGWIDFGDFSSHSLFFGVETDSFCWDLVLGVVPA